MPTYKCSNCNEYKRSKYEAGCYGSCGKKDCRDCCESCGQHTLFSTDVVKIGNELGLRQDNPVLPILQRLKNEVDYGNKRYFHWTIEQRTTQGYYGTAQVITYHKGGAITRHTLSSG